MWFSFLTANLALAFLSITIALFSLGLLIYVLVTRPYARMNVMSATSRRDPTANIKTAKQLVVFEEDVVVSSTALNEPISTRKTSNSQSSSVDQQSMLILSELGGSELVERQAEQGKLEVLQKEEEINHPRDDQSTIQMQDDGEVHKSRL